MLPSYRFKGVVFTEKEYFSKRLNKTHHLNESTRQASSSEDSAQQRQLPAMQLSSRQEEGSTTQLLPLPTIRGKKSQFD